jgi:hypothetical protein
LDKANLNYQKNGDDASVSPLTKFAYLGGDGFISKLEYLSSIAEQENWYYDWPKARNETYKKYGVLFQYIHHTFARAQDEGKIAENSECAVMNTGLFTPNGEEIYALFVPNALYGQKPGVQKWFLSSFYKESSHDIPTSIRNQLPAYVDYFADCPHDMYFDTTLKMFINIDHILDEHFERLPDSIKIYDRQVLTMLLGSAETLMRRKISRNNRLVVPQYYNRKIMYLAPLQIANDIVPLAIEKIADTYRVNTILSHGMAYCNARLLMKPESNWLTNDFSKKKTIKEPSIF